MVKHIFKAKSKSGNWIMGSLLDENFILPTNPNTNYWQHSDGSWIIDDYIMEILPETICQFTGLKDRDGVYVFEGDILASPVKKANRGKWESTSLIVVKDIRNIGLLALYIPEYKVIGNIHDNPELLEPKCEVKL